MSQAALSPSPGWLEEGWRRLGWVSAPVGGGDDIAAPVVPGAMVAGVLVDGDATLAVGGTVTEVRGQEVWAFGHPFLGGGGMQLPLARARVLGVLPSIMSSFKLFNVGRPVGSFEVDRAHGVWGRLGVEPAMVAVQVSADGRTYQFRCVRHRVLLPLLVGYLTAGCNAARGRTFGEQTLEVRLEVEYGDGQSLSLEQGLSSADAPASAAAMVSGLLGYLQSSPFPMPDVERVRVELDADEDVARADVVDVVAERSVVRPGETLGVRVRLQPRQGAELTRLLSVRVPSQVPDGPLDLVVADGLSWSAYDLQARPFDPGSFADELRLVRRLLPSTHLVLAFERADFGVAVRGASMPVPPSVVLALRTGLGPNLGTTTHQVVGVVEEVFPYPLRGAQRLTLRVRSEARQGQTPPAPEEP